MISLNNYLSSWNYYIYC